MAAFLSGAIYTVIVIVLVGVTIFVHELGHFLAAISFKMFVETFSIGFGPALWKKKINGITYKIGWIPFGGYVALPQLDPAAMALIQGSSKNSTPLPEVAPWKKIVVVAAGPTGNIVLAIALAFIISVIPMPPLFQDEGKPIIGMVEKGSEAELLGIKAGDEIVAVNSKKVDSWYQVMVECALTSKGSERIELTIVSASGETKNALLKLNKEDEIYTIDGVEKAMRCGVISVMEGSPAELSGIKAKDIIVMVDGQHVLGINHFIDLISNRGGKETTIAIQRGNNIVEIKTTPIYDETKGRAIIGAMIGPAIRHGESTWLRHRKPFLQIRDDFNNIARILKALVTPREAKQAASSLGGPVMIVVALVVSIKTSILDALGFLRFFNINLAVLNLLPLPILDGGHIMFALWEVVFRRKVSPKLVHVLTNIFAVLLLGVFVLITYKDVRQRLPKFFNGREKVKTEQKYKKDSMKESVPDTVLPTMPSAVTNGNGGE